MQSRENWEQDPKSEKLAGIGRKELHMKKENCMQLQASGLASSRPPALPAPGLRSFREAGFET
jgi:hypothetical protein